MDWIGGFGIDLLVLVEGNHPLTSKPIQTIFLRHCHVSDFPRQSRFGQTRRLKGGDGRDAPGKRWDYPRFCPLQTAHACFVFPNSPGRPRGCPTVSACLGGTEASLRADPVEADWSPFADEEEESCNSPSNRKLPIVSLGIDPWLKQGSGAIPSEFGKSLASSWQLQVYYRCLWKWLNKWLVSSWFPLMYQPKAQLDKQL